MAELVLYFSALFFCVLTTLILRKLGKKADDTPTPSNMPHGPRKLPIIGNIHNLLSSQPHRKLRDLALKYGPLMHLQLGEVSTIVISSPECAKEVMKTHDINFATRPKVLAVDVLSYNNTGIAFAPYANYWRQVRKICMLELLSLKRVNSYQSIREEELFNLVKWIDSLKGSPINLSQAVLSSIFTIVSRSAFGNRCKDHENFISLIKRMMKVVAGFDIVDFFPSATWLQHVTRHRLERLHQQADEIIESIIDDHKEAKDYQREEQDLVDVLMQYEDGSQQDFCLTRNNIKAIILDIFGAGGETSATTIDWAMAEMMKNSRVMIKAQAEVREVFNMRGKVDESCINELKYLKLVVKETLRLHPPLPLLLPRECGEACEIHGYHIPANSKVIINAWSIGRDPNYWTESERFILRDSLTTTLTTKGVILSIFLLDLEEGYALEAHLHPELWN
ncbi:ferulate-5-hydroxylase [Vigna unguiculata]|uniref:Ferulate-5-hydroxylase n=1 Tax=Vigna unguiculata TaxID=3917 RepID=A0A4D6KK88_VIGUN|nr:ferulate-5-hydroxylase [Vigna unguiculata]